MQHNHKDLIRVVLCPWSVKPGHGHVINEKTNTLIRKLYESGVVIIASAGNYGPLINTLNEIAINPYVISVGATSSDGKLLCDFSSRGLPGCESRMPTIVAPGVDIIGAWSSNLQKNIKQKAHDNEMVTPENIRKQTGGDFNSLEEFREDDYAAMSGTSMAASIVAGITGRIISMRIALNLDISPDIIKKILIDTAIPVPGYHEYEVGAGFVSIDTINTYFDNLDDSKLTLTEMWNNIKNLRQIWDRNYGNGVVIAILDGGIDLSHSEFR